MNRKICSNVCLIRFFNTFCDHRNAKVASHTCITGFRNYLITNTCSKSAKETLGKGMNYVQS